MVKTHPRKAKTRAMAYIEEEIKRMKARGEVDDSEDDSTVESLGTEDTSDEMDEELDEGENEYDYEDGFLVDDRGEARDEAGGKGEINRRKELKMWKEIREVVEPVLAKYNGVVVRGRSSVEDMLRVFKMGERVGEIVQAYDNHCFDFLRDTIAEAEKMAVAMGGGGGSGKNKRKIKKKK